MKQRARLAKAFISALFLAFLFYFVGTRDLASVLRNIDPLFFALSMLLMAVMIALSCLKWYVCLALIRADVPFPRLASIYLIGYYFSNLLPSNIGGDVVRSYYLGRSMGSQTRAAASVFIERFSGVLWLLVLGVTAPAFRPSLYASPYIALPAAGALGLLVLLLALATLPDPIHRIRRNLPRKLSSDPRATGFRWARHMHRGLDILERVHERIIQAAHVARRDNRALFRIVFLTAGFYVLTWLNVYLACRTFGARPDFLDVAAITPVIMLVSMVPVSLGSLGLAEGAYVFYFALIGMDPALALAVGLFMRFKVLLAGVVGFGFYLAHRHEPAAFLRDAPTE